MGGGIEQITVLLETFRLEKQMFREPNVSRRVYIQPTGEKVAFQGGYLL